MSLFDLDPGQRWLFCMTHPDDELAIAAWIRRLSTAGVEVWMSWTHDTPTRCEEAKAAADALGVPHERLRFFSATDGRVAEEMPALLPRYAAWMAEVAPTRVVCGAFEQGHMDHDATHLLVRKSFAGAVLEAPFYHTYLTRLPVVNRFADPSGEEVLDLTPDERAFKRRLARCYPSQRIAWNLFWANLDSCRRGCGRLDATERLRLATHTDFLSPNLPQPLADRVRSSPLWVRWEQAARAIL